MLDSSVLVFAERQQQSVSKLMDSFKKGEHLEIVLSAISVVELGHGVHRAKSPHQRTKRRDYLDTVFVAIPVEPFTSEIGRLVA